MINTKFDINILAVKAKRSGVNVIRYLFDNHVYKHVTKQAFESSSKAHNNSMVQIADHGLDHINVRIKTKGASEKIGG